MSDHEEDSEEETTTINFKPSFVLIAIDTHPCMFEITIDEDGQETHPFKEAVTACYEIADSLILSTSKSNYNQFGVVLVDEDQKASLIEVQGNLLDSIKKLKAMSSKSAQELRASYQRAGDIDLAAFLLLCRKKFKEINAAYYKRTIILITNDDDPVKGDGQKKFAALNEAKAFELIDIYLELVTMKIDFDYTKFYNELFHLYTNPPTTEEVCEDKDGLVEKLSNSIIYRYTKIRYKFFPFKNDYHRFLKVMKVNFIRQAKLYNSSKASPDGRILIKAQKDLSAVCQDPPKFVINTATQGRIEFDLKDKYDIYGNDLPLGLHLQYISNRQSGVGVVIDQVSLLLVDPKEELNNYFEQFWQYCVEKNKVLVCLKKYKHPFEIRYVELIPKFANDQKLFVIKDLPFCEEYKLPKRLVEGEPQRFNVTDEQKKAVTDLIEKLTWDYDPKMFINLSYSKKKAYVKAKLLDLPEEEVVDATNTSGMDEQIGDVVKDIERVFGFSGAPKGEKRKAAKGAPSKRFKK